MCIIHIVDQPLRKNPFSESGLLWGLWKQGNCPKQSVDFLPFRVTVCVCVCVCVCVFFCPCHCIFHGKPTIPDLPLFPLTGAKYQELLVRGYALCQWLCTHTPRCQGDISWMPHHWGIISWGLFSTWNRIALVTQWITKGFQLSFDFSSWMSP